jgi:SAM-dependent MidA family methyltransferase
MNVRLYSPGSEDSEAEISFDCLAEAQRISDLLSNTGGIFSFSIQLNQILSISGAALLIDYGNPDLPPGSPNLAPTPSLRAIRGHQYISPLENPGNGDLSAWVDFPAVKKVWEESKGEKKNFFKN